MDGVFTDYWSDLYGKTKDYLQDSPGGIYDWATTEPVEWWQSYDDTFKGKADRLKDLIIDMPAKGIFNAGQFLLDTATNTPGVVENLIAGKPFLPKEMKMRLDAWEGNPFRGTFYGPDQGGNPYANPQLMQYYEKLAGDNAYKYITTPESEGGWLNKKKNKKIWDAVDKKLNWDDWVDENPYRSYDDFKNTQNQLWHAELYKQTGDEWDNYYNSDLDRTLMERHGIGLSSAFKDWDWSEGELPESMFGYNTDKDKFLRQMEIVPELAADYLITKGALTASKQAAKQGAEYVSKGLGIQIPPGRSLYEKAQREPLFNRAREWKWPSGKR